MKKTLVVFVGNSSVSIVDQYQLHVQVDLPKAFILSHKNEVVFKKLTNVLHLQENYCPTTNVYENEQGSAIFVVDPQSPYMKVTKKENEVLLQQYRHLFVELSIAYDEFILVGESSCSFDVTVMEQLIDQLALLGKDVRVISWCPIQSVIALEHDASLKQSIVRHQIPYVEVTLQQQEEEFFKLFKAYNQEIANVLHEQLTI